MQGKLFTAKVLWRYDVVKVPGRHFDLEKTLLHYGFLAEPELGMTCVSVANKRNNAVFSE